MHLGQRIRARREHAGKTRTEIGAGVGISATAVAQWESDGDRRTEPTHDNLAAFCALIGISLAEFWGPVPTKRKVA